jgi:hypothetical protein
MLEHASISITPDTHLHLLPDMQEKAARLWRRLYPSDRSSPAVRRGDVSLYGGHSHPPCRSVALSEWAIVDSNH